MPEGLATDQYGAVVVLERSGEQLGCTGCGTVHDDNKGLGKERRPRTPNLLCRTGAIDRVIENLLLSKEESRNFAACGNEAAGIVAQVEHDALGVLLQHFLKCIAHLPGRMLAELGQREVTERRAPLGDHRRRYGVHRQQLAGHTHAEPFRAATDAQLHDGPGLSSHPLERFVS
ncbi:MAG TPA: hypothetical protein VHM88_17315 [Candidatus Acidoferrales bacterium]|nr:hypothetical protein [Candidatus Acidoferrales bacterium]